MPPADQPGKTRMLGWIGRDEEPAQIDALPEQDTAPEVLTGICAGTYIATERGWQPVERLRCGDRIMTFDHDLQPLLRIERQGHWPAGTIIPREAWPLLIPAGALDNRYDMLLPPGQALLVECEEEMLAGPSPFVTLPASALEGVRGIARQKPTWDEEVFSLTFATSEHVYAEGGTLIFAPANRVEAAKITLSSEEAAIVAQYFLVEDPFATGLGRSEDLAAASC